MPKGICGCNARSAYRKFTTLICCLIAVGVCASARGQATRSEARFSRGAEAEILFQQALLQYTKSKQFPEAEANFKKVIESDPADAEAYYYLGLVQVDEGKPAEAIESFNQSLKLDPTRQEVRAARATANIRAGRYDAAREDLNRLAPDPRWNSLVHYLRGQAAYAQGNLDEASSEFAAAKAAGGTEAEPAGFYQTLTYIRMRNMVKARDAFAETTIDPQRGVVGNAISRQLDRYIAPQSVATRRWTAEFDISYVYDSNVVQLGQGVQLPAGISNKPDSRIVLQPHGTYDFIRTDKLTAGVDVAGYFAFQFDLNAFDIASYQIGPYAYYRISQNVTAGLQYTFNYIYFGHDPYLNRNIVTPSLTISEPTLSPYGPSYTQIYYQFEARQFADQFATTAQRDSLDRDGQVHALGITQRVTLPEFFTGAGNASLKLDYRLGDQETHGSDYDGLANLVGATVYTPLPFWKLRADAGVSYEWDDYRHPNSFDSGGDDRFDQILNVTAGISRQLNKNVTFRVDYTYTHDDSNVSTTTATGTADPFGYDRHQVGVRLLCTF